MNHLAWTVCTWNDEYWHKPSEGWEPVLSGLTLCRAMEVVVNLESRGWDRDVSIGVHNLTTNEIVEAWKKYQPEKTKAATPPATKVGVQRKFFEE